MRLTDERCAIDCYETGWAQSEVQEITYGITEKLPGFMKTGKFTDKGTSALMSV